MKKVGIVGLGNISRKYKKGIEESKSLILKAICDLQTFALENSVFSDCSLYTDYKKMIDEEKLDYIIVSTPPSTHFEICSYALHHGTSVIVEKPITLSMDDYLKLQEIADEVGLELTVIFHWQNGIEVEKFCEKYNFSGISKIDINVQDPYSSDGVSVLPEKQGLMGVWLDSGVNALSLVKIWAPFDNVDILQVEHQKCIITGQPIYIRACLMIDGIEVVINVDWRNGVNRKETFLVYDNRNIHIDHSGQRIVDGDMCYDYCRMDRLEEHYYNYFKYFTARLNRNDTRKIHEVLFRVAELL